MSYTRRYSEVVSRTISVSYSYPASQNGGSGSTSVTVDIPVDVNIHVDTTPFDSSVEGCNVSVNTLTGAVAATEVAQIASIDTNARKVADTVIQGFFKNIRFEISSQVMELKQKIDAHLIHLFELSKQLDAKKVQMETDYNRTAGRYNKIFDDLNNELSNRIFELDKPAFQFKRLADTQSNRTSDNDLVSTVAVSGAEGSDLQARLSASITKKRALNAINQANIFLSKQKRLQHTITKSMLNDSTIGPRFVPVCYMETKNDKNQIAKSLYQTEYLSKLNENSVIEDLQSKNWVPLANEKKDSLRRYFISALSNFYPAADPHTSRIKETIIKIFDLDAIQSI